MASPKKDQANLRPTVHRLEQGVQSLERTISRDSSEMREAMRTLSKDLGQLQGQVSASQDSKKVLYGALFTALLALVSTAGGSWWIAGRLSAIETSTKLSSERILRLEGYHLAAQLEAPLPEGDSTTVKAVLQEKIEAAEYGQAKRVPVEPALIAESAKDLLQRSWAN